MTDPARHAGTWYPASPAELSSTLDRYNDVARGARSGAFAGRFRAAILPHAGLVFSGTGMAALFAPLRDALDGAVPAGSGECTEPTVPAPQRVVILSPSHYVVVPSDTIVVADFDEYESPLGTLRGDPEIARLLAERSAPERSSADGDRDGAPRSESVTVYLDNGTISREHGVEMFYPFLSHVLPGITVVPIVVGPFDRVEEVRAAAAFLDGALESRYGAEWRGETLLIVSSDFTHYGDRFRHTPFGRGSDAPERVREEDLHFAGLAACGDTERFFGDIEARRPTICGRYPIALLLALLEGQFVHGSVAYYGTSLDPKGEYFTQGAGAEPFEEGGSGVTGGVDSHRGAGRAASTECRDDGAATRSVPRCPNESVRTRSTPRHTGNFVAYASVLFEEER